MSTIKRAKINQLLSTLPKGVVILASWLKDQGYSLDLQKRYKHSNWLESVGTGAMKRFGERVGYEGAVYALQKQAGYSIHPGGKTALAIIGKAHYLDLSTKRVYLFGAQDEKLPAWFKNHDWGVTVEYVTSSFLPSEMDLIDIEHPGFSIKTSGAGRALLECLYLAPKHQDLVECYEVMEGLTSLRPTLVQQLLEQCSSIKVKRLFLYMAEKAGHQWFKYLDLQKVDLGSGKRSVIQGGVYVSKYQITVPKELEQHDQRNL